MYTDVTIIILAGGQASRMGNIDKGLMMLAGKPLITHSLERMRDQVGNIIISANRNLSSYAAYADAVVHDEQQNYQGPLAGIYAALQEVSTPLCFVFPCDVPFLNDAVLESLYSKLKYSKHKIAIAYDGQYTQPLVMLLHTDIRDPLGAYLQQGKRKVMDWITEQGYITVDFSLHPEWFDNINTPDECKAAEQRLVSHL